VALIALTN